MLCGWFGDALKRGGVRAGGSGLAEATLATEFWVSGVRAFPRPRRLVRRDAVTSTSTRGHPSLSLVETRSGRESAGRGPQKGGAAGRELATPTRRDLDEDFGALQASRPAPPPQLFPPSACRVLRSHSHLIGRAGLGLDSQHLSCYSLSGDSSLQAWFSRSQGADLGLVL